jgi:hypothetical protein
LRRKRGYQEVTVQVEEIQGKEKEKLKLLLKKTIQFKIGDRVHV